MRLFKDARVPVLCWALFWTAFASADTLKSIQVTPGENKAQISFQVSSSHYPVPAMNVLGNVVELTFTGVDLGDDLREHAETVSPHPLIHRIASYSPEHGVVHTRVVINGTPDDLADRVTLSREGDKVQLSVAYPKGQSAVSAVLSDEQLPVTATVSPTKAAAKDVPAIQIFLVVLILLGAGVGTYFFAKFMKKRGPAGLRGSRKYLVEQLSYCSLGAKTGVSLLRVGNEFVLVGVTANQVTLLSQLPKLQNQYEAESSLEREHFKVAVEEELSRIRPNQIRQQ